MEANMTGGLFALFTTLGLIAFVLVGIRFGWIK
jgi:hypothetical protein